MKDCKSLYRLFRNLQLIAAVVLLLLRMTVNPAHAQSNERLLGRVYDARNGAPIVGALVQVEATMYGAQTDENGLFRIENIPPGQYTLTASMIGYATGVLSNVQVSEDVYRQIEIGLTPVPIPTDSVFVVGVAEQNGSSLEGEKIVLSSETIQRFQSLGVAPLLQQVAGVQIESTGGGDSRAIIRIHGSSAKQVLVLLDGQRLNNPHTGEVDLGDIPIEQIETIEVIRQGNTALFGGNAFAGVIIFRTKKHVVSTHFGGRASLGSFSTSAGSAEFGGSLGNFSLRGNYRQDYSRQNFRFPYQGESLQRKNAWYRNRKVFLKLSHRSSSQRTNLLYNYRQGKQGLPSAFYEEMNHFNAFKEGASQAWQFNHRRFLGSNGFVDALVAYHRLVQSFNNEKDFSPFTRYHVRQTNTTLEGRVSARWYLFTALETRLGISYLQEQLQHTNLLFPTLSIGEKQRRARGIFGGAEWKLPTRSFLWKSLTVRSAFRLESYFEQPFRGYPLLGVSVVPRGISAVTLSAGFARAVRYPDLNSLFWKGDARARGNPSLLPEESTVWNAALRFRAASRFLPQLSIYSFYEDVRHLIFWHRSVNGVWEPRNEDKAAKKGVDVQLQYPLLPGRLHLQFAYSFLEARNKSDEPNRRDKLIPFIPRHTLTGSVWSQIGFLQLLVNYRQVSKRHIVPANTAVPLSPYHLWDALLTAQHSIDALQIRAGFVIKNFTDTPYELLFGYPMPGREYQLTLTLTYNHH